MPQDLDQAISLLKEYSGIIPKTVDSEIEKEQLRSAIKLLVSLADAQNFGICATNSQDAFEALNSYLKALGYDLTCPTNTNGNENSVYLKFSTERMSYKISDYDGEYRGVLITIFAENQENILGTYGHLPMNLFVE